MAYSKISVLVADEQPLVAESLAGALALDPRLRVIGHVAHSGLDAFEVILSEKPDVTLLDYWMPDIEGPAVVRLVHARQPQRRIILTSWFHTAREVQNSVQSGAAGFFPKSAGIDDLAEGVWAALTPSGPVLPEPMSAGTDDLGEMDETTKAAWARLDHLSRRQIEVIGLISLDFSPAEIAERLEISPGTIKVHVRNILAKTGAVSQREVVALARSVGLIRN